ncbi:MAG: hypothetical protein AB7I30_10245, partial [Isosphaeraceae bacterium]
GVETETEGNALKVYSRYLQDGSSKRTVEPIATFKQVNKFIQMHWAEWGTNVWVRPSIRGHAMAMSDAVLVVTGSERAPETYHVLRAPLIDQAVSIFKPNEMDEEQPDKPRGAAASKKNLVVDETILKKRLLWTRVGKSLHELRPKAPIRFNRAVIELVETVPTAESGAAAGGSPRSDEKAREKAKESAQPPATEKVIETITLEPDKTDVQARGALDFDHRDVPERRIKFELALMKPLGEPAVDSKAETSEIRLRIQPSKNTLSEIRSKLRKEEEELKQAKESGDPKRFTRKEGQRREIVKRQIATLDGLLTRSRLRFTLALKASPEVPGIDFEIARIGYDPN